MDELESSTNADSVFSALSNPQRRWVVREIPPGATITLDDLARRCAESSIEGTGTGYQQVYLALQHVHLPKLAQTGLLQYDPETRTVTATDVMNDILGNAIEDIEWLRTKTHDSVA